MLWKDEKAPSVLNEFAVLKQSILSIIRSFFSKRYNDVIMSAMASQIISVFIVCITVGSAQLKENIKALCDWPLCGEFTGDRWILRTKGLVTRKICFHLMTFSWYRQFCEFSWCAVYSIILLYGLISIYQYVFARNSNTMVNPYYCSLLLVITSPYTCTNCYDGIALKSGEIWIWIWNCDGNHFSIEFDLRWTSFV